MTVITLEIGTTPNHATVTVGQLDLFFSYRTLVAVEDNETLERIVSVNAWGPTTGKHLNRIDGGSPAAKAERLERDVFERRAGEVLARYGLSSPTVTKPSPTPSPSPSTDGAVTAEQVARDVVLAEMRGQLVGISTVMEIAQAAIEADRAQRVAAQRKREAVLREVFDWAAELVREQDEAGPAGMTRDWADDRAAFGVLRERLAALGVY